MENPKVCYVINFYLGDRRKPTPQYENDKLIYLKKHIEYLSSVKHNLSKIIFNFNIRPEDYKFVTEIFTITPKKINSTDVLISFRKNSGMSYGAWSDVFEKYTTEFDYYIFNEDDYFFIEPDFDTYLVNKYNSYDDCGYLCVMVRNPDFWNNFQKHAGHSAGIASSINLLKVFNKYKCLPHNKGELNYLSGENSQIKFSFAFIEIGLNVYDICDDYKVSFNMTGEFDHDTWILYDWNKKELIIPAVVALGNIYSWRTSNDLEFSKEFIHSTQKEAWECFTKKISLGKLRYNL